MGGLFFILSAIITFFVFAKSDLYISVVSISIILGFLIVGFIDDFIKIKNKNNQGLTAGQKLAFQISVSIIASTFAYSLYLLVWLGW